MPRGIRQRGDRYEGRFMWEGVAHSVTGATIKEVQQKITDEKYRLEHGTYIKRSAITVDDWYKGWLERNEGRWKQLTRDNYRQLYKNHIQQTFGKMQISAIRPGMIRLWVEQERKSYTPGTVESAKSVLRCILADAVDHGIIMACPVPKNARGTLGTVNKRPALSAEEQKVLLEHMAGSKYYNIVLLQLYTGMRIGEVVGLKVQDIDWDTAVLNVKRTLEWTSVGIVENEPKTKAGMREIPMLPIVQQLLKEQCGTNTEGYVFHRPNGRPIDPRLVNADLRMYTALIRATGRTFPATSTHVLRHSFATRAIEAGMNPQTLKTILGHSSLAMTMDLYAHVLHNTKAAEMALLAD